MNYELCYLNHKPINIMDKVEIEGENPLRAEMPGKALLEYFDKSRAALVNNKLKGALEINFEES